MSLKILDDRIKNGNVSGVYLLYGEETFDINKYLEKMKKTFGELKQGINYFELDKSNVNTLSDICDSVSFFGSDKFIVIKDTGLKFNAEILDQIDKEDICIVILQTSVDKRISEYKYLSKNACVVEFAKLKETDAVMYVVRTLSGYKIKVNADVAEYMVACCGTDKSSLVNEFKKIVSYLGKEAELTRKTIDMICVKTTNAKVFDMLDLAVNKKNKEALKELKELFSQKESPIGISIMLFKQVKQMYMIKLMEKKLKRDNANINVAEMLGIHPFVYGKLKAASSKYTIKELENIIKDFDEYDRASKIGEMDMEQGIIQIIMNI